MNNWLSILAFDRPTRGWVGRARADSTCSTRSATAERCAEGFMAAALGVMALAVFINVVLRYGFGSGIAACEELSRLLFVWMVFIGAVVAYPAGGHMAFTSLLRPLQRRPAALRAMSRLIHVFVVLSCSLLGWGAWLQVEIGLASNSVVMGYSMALVPLPALLSSVAIGAMALRDVVRGKSIAFDTSAEVE